MAGHISSVVGFLWKLKKMQRSEGEVLAYRGHESGKYKLQASVFRGVEARKAESSIVREMISLHPAEFRHDNSTLEQLVRMQHYDLPTRLLDITWNPLTALYFACRHRQAENGKGIIFRIRKSALRHYDSDTVSCVSNLSKLTREEKILLWREVKEWRSNIWAFNKLDIVIRLLH